MPQFVFRELDTLEQYRSVLVTHFSICLFDVASWLNSGYTFSAIIQLKGCYALFSAHPKNKYVTSLCLGTGVVNFDHYIKGVFARFPHSEVTIFPWVINKYINTLFEIRYFTKLVSKRHFLAHKRFTEMGL